MKSLIFFLFLSSITFAQSIEGVVLDTETNKPVKAAHVYITNIEQGTITNYRGKFKLKLSMGPNPSLLINRSSALYTILPYTIHDKHYNVEMLQM